jgi:tetratricopeptide (TPR) repeat protein
MVRMGILTAVVLGLLLGAPALTLYAADKESEKSSEKTMSQPAAAEKIVEAAGVPAGQNVEKLLYTLNETLQENRKIREGMRNLQDAFEKTMLEKSDLMSHVQKVEKMAIQRTKDAGQRVEALSAELEASKKEMEKLQAGNKSSVEQKIEVEKKLEAISAENTKMQELLKGSILTPERDQIVERMKMNEAAVQNAVTQVSAMDGENVALKQRLIQAYFDLGNMFYDLGRYEDAAVQYLNVLEWDPDHAWAHHNLAVIYDYHLRKIPEARDHYQKYLHLKSPSEEAGEARMRLWDLTQLTKVTPAAPLKQDFDQYQKMPRA